MQNNSARKYINIALQGGGSHGAFAWGALDRILEDQRIAIEGIVGTSAGAINAAITAYGITRGGNEGARKALREFWKSVSETGSWSALHPSWIDRLINPWNLDFSPGLILMETFSRILSPYQVNPANYHPLRDILSKQIDFEQLRQGECVKLFVCASNVMTNRLRVFDRNNISVDAVLASACLPTLFQAIEIEGEFFWDGGYMGNPPIFPIIYNCKSTDVVLIMINPIHIEQVPQTAQAILDRINTLSFNSSLMREMRAINFVNELVDSGFDDGGQLKKMLVHCIDAENEMINHRVSSKLNVGWDFLTRLFELGHKCADTFLRQHFDRIGSESSTSIAERFL